jgi:hypothetical protein
MPSYTQFFSLKTLNRSRHPGMSGKFRALTHHFDVLFKLLNNLRVDEQQCFCFVYQEADEDACDIREDLGQEGMEVKIAFPVSHNSLTSVEEYVQ